MQQPDVLIVKIKKPELFVSVESGVHLYENEEPKSDYVYMPKQLPQGVDEEAMIDSTKSSSKFGVFMFILQILISIKLKSSLAKIKNFYLVLQLIVAILILQL